MNNEDFKKHVLNSVREVFGSLEPDGELMPLFMLFTGKDLALMPVPHFMDSPASKDAMVNAVRKICVAKGITMLAFISEVWKASLPAGVDRSEIPNSLADYQGEKTEQAMIRMEFKGFEPELYFAEINRKVSPPTLGEFTKADYMVEGRFAPAMLPQDDFPI